MRPTKTTTGTEMEIEKDIEIEKDVRDERPKVVYNPHDQLDIPEAIKKHFLKQGFKLRYIRFMTDGQPDTMNIRKRTHQGYTFVTAKELERFPEFVMFADQRDVLMYQGLLTIGDVALAKIHVDRANAHKKQLRDFTTRQMSEVDSLVKQHDLKLQRKTHTTYGKKRSFADDGE